LALTSVASTLEMHRHGAVNLPRPIQLTRRTSILRTLAFLIASVAFAQGPFDGTWRIDEQKNEFSRKPVKMELANGMYTCSTCVPKMSVKADRTDQKVEGDRSFDTASVQAIDDRTVQITYKKAGKIFSVSKYTVEPDGSRLTRLITVHAENSPQPLTETRLYSRVEKGASGSHAMSGAWTLKSETASENVSTFSLKSTGDGIGYSSPAGYSYTAKFDGKDYAFKGDPNTDNVSLKQIDANTFEESDKKAGKVIDVTRFTVSADGHTLTVVDENKLSGRTSKYFATKQ
jgi:hypothetical protein